MVFCYHEPRSLQQKNTEKGDWSIILHSWHLLEKLTVDILVKKFPVFSEVNAFHCHVNKTIPNQLRPAHNYVATDPNGKQGVRSILCTL